MYSDCLVGRYTGLGAQTLAPEKLFKFSFLSCISTKKYVEVVISDFTMHLISYFEIVYNTKIQTEKKN